MANKKPDNKADFLTDSDGGENSNLMEPLLLASDSRHRPAITDLAISLAAKSSALRSSLPIGIRTALAALVRNMNCYYSNLIEGHNTHPIDIERALNNDYSKDATKRNLQLEAKAHVQVQSWIDQGGLSTAANTKEALLTIHRKFCEHLPAELLALEGVPIIPGEIRRHAVGVGSHIPISPGAVSRFLDRYEEVYASLGSSESLIAAAAAHHRLLWIHPFIDANGRVARLVSHAQLLNTLDTQSIWSIARGLARNEQAYKQHLAACDQTRRNSLDGRGNLSEEALAEFTKFFLRVCIDQVEFMESLVQPEKLRGRILSWAHSETNKDKLLPNSGAILEAILYRGELPRSDVPRILGLGDRQARRVVSGLANEGVLVSQSDRAPLHLAFPAALAPSWMPGLFPDRPTD
ncbi:MAG: Fic family protein [Candidatus Obscuribacterales bacterium]|nr:Fic family protein [Candidatus Obscuribacterales bacterium]